MCLSLTIIHLRNYDIFINGVDATTRERDKYLERDIFGELLTRETGTKGSLL